MNEIKLKEGRRSIRKELTKFCERKDFLEEVCFQLLKSKGQESEGGVQVKNRHCGNHSFIAVLFH